MDLPAPGSTERTRVRRLPDKAIDDRAVAYAVLDAAIVGHVALVQHGQPFVLPVAYARRADEVVFHGSTGSRLFRALADAEPVCFSVTILDGLVVARSLFESSMNYRSVMVLGTCRRLQEDDELDALRTISDHLLPGRWTQARQPSPKERAATMTLALSLAECSVKVSDTEPTDDPEDLIDPVYSRAWGGRIPLLTTWGTPIPDRYSADQPLPEELGPWRRP